MKLQGKQIAIFVASYYEDLEFWYPYYRLKEEGAMVMILGPEQGKFKGKKGLPVTAEYVISDVNPDDFDALVIPGGYSPDHMRRSPQMVDFVKKMNDDNKIIAAICHAAWMLVSADVLKERMATSFFSIKDDVVNAGAKWVDKEVVIDGNLITSRKPDDLPAFCRTIIESVP